MVIEKIIEKIIEFWLCIAKAIFWGIWSSSKAFWYAWMNWTWLRVAVIGGLLASLLSIKHTKIGIFYKCYEEIRHINNPKYEPNSVKKEWHFEGENNFYDKKIEKKQKDLKTLKK